MFPQTSLQESYKLPGQWFILLGDTSQIMCVLPFNLICFPLAPKYLGQMEESPDLQSL